MFYSNMVFDAQVRYSEGMYQTLLSYPLQYPRCTKMCMVYNYKGKLTCLFV